MLQRFEYFGDDFGVHRRLEIDAVLFELRAQLFGVAPGDPTTLIATVGLLALVALFASWLPARRAAAVDPTTAMRVE